MVDLVVEPELHKQAAESPPPTTVNAFVSAIAWATVRVPTNRSSSNMPIGPFQNTMRASMITSVKAAADPGPMSNPLAPSGRFVPNVAYSPSAVVPVMSSGRWIVLPHAGLGEQTAARVDLVGFEQRVTDRLALGGEEREAHRSADHERIDHLEQCFDHAELVGDLRPAEDRDEGVLGLVAQAQEHLDLLLEEATHRGRHELRRADDRRVRSVRGTEGVVDVAVDAVDELGDERRIVGGLARVEPQVLQESHPGR